MKILWLYPKGLSLFYFMKIMYRLFLLSLALMAFQSAAQTPCEDGMAGNYPCRNVDLISHLTAGELLAIESDEGVYLNDIWGWTDPMTDKEYVLVAMANGTSFVDISDPSNPIMLGRLPDHNEVMSLAAKVFHDTGKSSWRDVKVYQNHAYMVGEEADQGVQVFDLTQLRDVTDPPITFGETSYYGGLGNAHNIAINETSGYAYVVGSTNEISECQKGGLHILDLTNPADPNFETCYDGDGYVHDVQCVIYQGPDINYQGMEICFSSNEDTFTIYDVNAKDSIEVISREPYENNWYTHQGWLTEDHRYFLLNDELDEFYPQNPTRTLIWDVSDLTAPVLIGEYIHNTMAIDHNLYVVGNTVYESNYTEGLRILDLENVAQGELREKAFFDTYPQSKGAYFYGSWSNYPFFSSGVIAVTDITNGLFLLRESYTETYIVKQPKAAEACYQENHVLGVEAGGENLSYQWQIDKGSGFVDITELDRYQNTNTDSLLILDVSYDQDGYEFRCRITPQNGETIFSETSPLTVWDCTLDVAQELSPPVLYPNPTRDYVQFSDKAFRTFSVYSISGKRVHMGRLDQGAQRINLSGLPAGIYLVEVIDDQGRKISEKIRKL